MAHLIQPITVAGSARCNTCQLGRATPAYITNNIIPGTFGPNSADVSTPCGPWTLMDTATSLEGEITFGVSCGETTEILLDVSSSDGGEMTIRGYIDGDFDQEIVLASGSSDSIILIFSNTPCGTLITITCEANFYSGGEIVTASITSIT